jgi:integrase/recombinase XerD
MSRFFTDPCARVRVSAGPLGPYLARYASELRVQHYARTSALEHIRVVADFSRWLDRRHVAACRVTGRHTQAYLRWRADHEHRARRNEAAALTRLLDLLRELAIIPAPPAQVLTPTAHVVAEFDRYLQQERALAPATRVYYRWFVSQFLTERCPADVQLCKLRATDVTAFVQRQAARLHRHRAQLLTTALRAFFRFATQRGEITVDLAAAVPSVANWSMSTVPRSLLPGDVERVLAHCNRQTAAGRRDFAMLLLLARLGLRAGEVRALTLEDIDWTNGRLTVHGKSGVSQLPLPVDVGSAIAAYVQNGRPRDVSSRCIFLRGRAPIRGFRSSSSVGTIVKEALARAGVDSLCKGSHLFRHTLATQMLRHGASLDEIGELLRHRSPETTAIYAKVDLASLRSLAVAWPGGDQ